jgi:anthranilate phosphoribosyltransferase
MNELIERVRAGEELEESQVKAVAGALLDEAVAAELKADFLSALAVKGETPGEIAAFVNAFLEHAVDPGLDESQIDAPLIDVCGTGGDKLDLFNVSTTAVFVLAACEVCVVKHGNRGITSKSGGADVLEALGIRIDLPPEEFCECVKRVGAGFLFAQKYHPAFKAVAPVRKMLAERGQRTVFNILGPLLNPVRPAHQLIGVFDADLPPVFADILGRLGRERAWAVHGKVSADADAAGMDEVSILGPTRVSETLAGTASELTLTPGEFGGAVIADDFSLEQLRGGDAEENAGILRGMLDGSVQGAKRAMILANVAAALVVANRAANVEEGAAQAAEAIDSGRAIEVLRRWQNFSA